MEVWGWDIEGGQEEVVDYLPCLHRILHIHTCMNESTSKEAGVEYFGEENRRKRKKAICLPTMLWDKQSSKLKAKVMELHISEDNSLKLELPFSLI